MTRPAEGAGRTKATHRAGWAVNPGEELVPGRIAQEVLGGGERFEVYIAWNERLMANTVVKVLRPAFVDEERARRSVAAEGELLRGLEHPGLTRVFGLDTEGARPFIELEHVEGPRLSTLVRRHGRLNPEQAFPLGRQVAATLAFLHAEGVVHLDVKPSNIIMGPVPRLIDLSVARTIERAHRINGYVGTDRYMAPEQADPARWATIGPAADSWGLGATLYHAITKRPPFSRGRHEASGEARFPQLVERPPALDPKRHSGSLIELVAAMLAPTPDDRPAATELFERFDELSDRAGVGKVRFR